MDMFPLAWLLILCDELQCWDRTAYGRDSRTELAPMAVEFDFSNNRLIARYLFDEEEQDKIDDYLWKFVAWKQAGKPGKAPELKAYSDIADENKSFVRNIEMLVDTTGIPLTVVCDIAPVNRGVKHVYLSDSSFLHLYDFAMALNARYAFEGREDEVDRATLEEAFARVRESGIGVNCDIKRHAVLYPTLALRMGGSAASIERSMRYAIDGMWRRMSAEERRGFQPWNDEKPGNKRFLTALLERLENEEKIFYE
jgi:hypothetical protein